MAEFISITILPEQPVAADRFEGYLVGALVEVFDIHIDDFLPGAPAPSPLTSHTITTADFITPGDDSFVALKIPHSIPPDSVDLRVKITSVTGELIVDQLVNYQFPVEDNPSGSNTEPSKHTDGYIFVPVGDGGFGELFNTDGKAPKYQTLLDAVNAVLAADGSTTALEELNWEQCLHVARECAWQYFPTRPPRPNRKKVKTLYDFKENAEGAIDEDGDRKEYRSQFESDIRKHYSNPETKAQQLAQYIRALSCAKWAENKSAGISTILFRLPTVAPDITPRELVIKNLSAGHVRIDAQFFYALGVDLPSAVTREARYEQFISAEQQLLLDSFAKAEENRITSWSTTGQTVKQVVRLARAQHANRPELPVFDAEDESAVDELIGHWSGFDEENSIDFWSDLSSYTNAEEGHRDLVNYLLVEGHTLLYDFLDNLDNEDFSTVDQAQWEAWYEEVIISEDFTLTDEENQEITDQQNESVSFLPAGTVEEKTEFFALHALAFFNQNVDTTSEDLEAIALRPIPAFQFSDNPIGDFDFENGDIDTYIDDEPLDECGKDWLRKKLTIVSNLRALTVGIENSALRQTAMETLYTLGITRPEQLQLMGEEGFQQCVKGTMLEGYTFDDLGYSYTEPDPDTSEIPEAVNDGRLTDCHYPSYVTKTGRYAYLKDLLAFELGGKPVQEQLAELTGLNFSSFEVSTANAEMEVPQVEIVNTVLGEAVCAIEGTGGTTSCWRPHNVLMFVNALLSIDADDFEEVIQNAVQGLNVVCDPAVCIRSFFEELLIIDYSHVGTLLSGIVVDSIRSLMIHVCASTPFEELIASLNSLTNNQLSGLLVNCIQIIEGMTEVERENCASLVSQSLIGHVLQDPISHFIQQPVEEEIINVPGVSGISIGNTPAANAFTEIKLCAYEPLTQAMGHCSLPYHFLEDTSNSYLQRLGMNRYQLLRKFCTSIHAFAPASGLDSPPEGFEPQRYRFPLTLELSLAYLGISQAEYELFYAAPPILDPTAPDGPYLYEWYGLGDWTEFEELHLQKALDVLCLDCCELLELSQVQSEQLPLIISTRGNSTSKFTNCETCNLRDYYIDFDYPPGNQEQHAAAYWRLFLISRLYRLLKQQHGNCYTFADLITLVEDLQWFTAYDEVDPNFPIQLAAVDLLRTEFGVCSFFDQGEDRSPITLLLEENHAQYPAMLEHFVDSLVEHCESGKPEEECRPPVFRKLLVEHISLIAELTGLSSNIHDHLAWNRQFSNIIRFAEQLHRICSSPFSLGQLQFMFTANEQLVGDDPAPLQTINEAEEYPLGLTDSDPELTLARLREKLLVIELTDEEVDAYTWSRIDSILRSEFGYGPDANNDEWAAFSKFFFPDTLSSLGYSVSNTDRQVRTGLPISGNNPQTAPQMWNTGTPSSPFHYDGTTEELFVSLPISMEGVLEKLKEVRQLNEYEETAVIICLQKPLALFNTFAGLFTDVQEAQKVLLETADEAARWKFFARAFAHYHRSCQLVTEHLTDQIGTELGQAELDPRLTWKILAKLHADDNPNENDWESTTDDVDLTWKLPWQASAFTALCGLRGGGLLGEYFSLENSKLLYREIRNRTEANGTTANSNNIGILGLLPALNYNLPEAPAIAQIRNGLAFSQQNGAFLGGAQGWLAKYCGVLYVEERGKYHFRVGAPTPVGEAPDFEAIKHAKWYLELKRGNKTYQVLDHEWESPGTPEDCSAPLQLKPGAYQICFWYENPQRSFQRQEDDCLLESGWAIKWQTPGREDWQVIGTKHLYHRCPYGDLSIGVEAVVDVDATAAIENALKPIYRAGYSGIRRTYLRAYAAGLLFHGFGVEADEVSDTGQSEADYLLSHPEEFAGTAFSSDGTTYQAHVVPLNLDMLPVLDHYCPPDEIEDKRSAPGEVRIAAWFAIWERLWEMRELKSEAAKEGLDSVWLLYQECYENHLNGASKLHLEGYLGIHPNHHKAVTAFCPDKTVACEDLHSELWAIRVWKAHQCLHQWMCRLGNLDFTDVIPAQWAATTYDADGEQAYNSFVSFVSNALQEGSYPRNRELQSLQEGITKRSLAAFRAYLEQREEAALLLTLIPTTANGCSSCTRLDFAIGLVQSFLNSIRIGIIEKAAIRFTEKQRLRWENKLSTYESWKKCQLIACRPEDFIEHEILQQDRKSAGFQLLEDQLSQNVLSMPVSGGTTFINPANHPPLGNLLPLQSRQNAIMNTTTQALGTRTPSYSGSGVHHGRPALPVRPDWDSAATQTTAGASIDFWLETVQRAGRRPVRIAAAGAPTANLHIGCDDGSCCPGCNGEVHHPVHEWWFWLMDSSCYKEVKQACEQWKLGYQLAELLYMPTNPMVYLAWAQVSNGYIQQIRWSSEGIEVDQEPGVLKFRGRFGDSLYLEVEGGSTSLEPTSYNPDNPNDPIPIYDDQVIKPGFRFDIVIQSAVTIPKLDEAIPFLSDNEEAPLSYFFSYFDEGAPPIPKQPHGISLLVAAQLQNHCEYAAAKDWLDVSVSLSNGQLGWDRYFNNETVLEDTDARRRRLVMAHLENIQAWIKHLHRKNTKESLNQAMQLLELVEKRMGPRPVTLNKGWNDNIALEEFQPLPIGLNPRLFCLYDEFADVRSLLEHCLSADRRSCHEDVVTAAGCAQQHCCSPWETCLPESPYRFQTLLNYAKEYAGQLSALGDALLSAFEKGENEALSFIRESQGRQMQDLSLQIKENLAIEAKFNVDAAKKALEITQKRLMYYQGLINIGLIAEEQDNLSLTDQAMVLDAVSQVVRISSQGPNFVPTVFIGPFPLTETPGGRALANWFQAGSDAARIAGGIQRTRAGKKATLASYDRRLTEWEHQRDVLTLEVKQLEIQLLAAKRRFANASHELDMHRLQLDHSRQTLQFLKDKFTNEELYHWQREELSKLLYQMFTCSLQVALQAEKACNVEQGHTQQKWLDMPFWNNFREGLISGRKLNTALRKMELDYMNQNQRRYELSKAISLHRDFPHALLQLKYSGKAFFELPEALFDGDYPGHYCRMIRSVSLTFACVVGPYTNVNATLTLMGSKVRVSPRLASSLGHCRDGAHTGYKMQKEDNRFVILPASNQAMATSKGVQDSGMFQLNFQDERLLTFENHGVNARFCLDMPIENNQFDMQTISDVVMEINYIAKEGGMLLSHAAEESRQSYLPGNGGRLICMKDDRPDDWYQFQEGPGHRLGIHLSRQDFAYIPGAHQLFVNQLEVFIETTPCPPCDSMDVYFQEPDDSECIDCDDTLIRCIQLKQLGGLFHGILSHHFDVSDERQLLGSLKFPEGVAIKRVYLLLGYGKKVNSCSNHGSDKGHCDC